MGYHFTIAAHALILIGLNMAKKDDTAQPEVNNNDPTYKSEHTDTVVYSPEGALSYRLIAEHVEYYSDQAVSGLQTGDDHL